MIPSHEPYGPPLSISEAIERERIELMQVHAMLKCLYEVLLYADDDDSVMHADVANVCARLLSECIVRLDAVRLQTLQVQDIPAYMYATRGRQDERVADMRSRRNLAAECAIAPMPASLESTHAIRVRETG